jgi:hypothetical protein
VQLALEVAGVCRALQRVLHHAARAVVVGVFKAQQEVREFERLSAWLR